MSFLIPLILGAASMVSQNANNKAAIKNNEVQQASAVGNTQQAYNTAKGDLAGYEAAHPAPFQGAVPNRPTPGAYGGGVQAPASYNVRTGAQTPGQGSTGLPPQVMALIQTILNAPHGYLGPNQRLPGGGGEMRNTNVGAAPNAGAPHPMAPSGPVNPADVLRQKILGGQALQQRMMM